MQPMTDQALDTLEMLLETQAAPHGGMSLEMLDGYLSALVVGPVTPSPEQYTGAIWGDGPAPDEDQARTRSELVTGLWHHISWRVAQPLPEEDETDDETSDPLMPLVQFPAGDAEAEPEDGSVPEALVDFPAGAEWAQGFFAGVGLAEQAWDGWIDDDEDLADDVAMLSRLGLYSAEHAKDVGVDADEVPGFEERLEMIGAIPEILAHCHALRLASSGARGDGATLH
ncbi:YecA family protein [Luteimonas deserti]|uniref:YecA family protein n=1 Tax=Luteimonas deserti TaxID=2752306 RepID=A0A7Z0QPS4_9GAMM|nr:YecA family protein [Luteimonas deserti]NYZ62473.1 YecA family protein [Luteimonas deserti]